MAYQPYPKYGKTQNDWIDSLPEHWDLVRLKTGATYRVSNVDKVPKDDEQAVRLCNYVDVYYNERITLDLDLMDSTATTDEINRFRLMENDLIITKDSEDWRDIAVPALVVETAEDLVCGYHLAIIRPDPSEFHGPYLLRALQSSGVNQQFCIAASGVTRYGLPKSAIGGAWLPKPPVDEQYTIAEFLDRETALIEHLIAAKKSLIERLKEKRIALISNTVVQGLPTDAARAAGLNPGPNRKSSGLDWIDDVPEHWEIKRLKYVASTNDEVISEQLPLDTEIIYVDIGSVDPVAGIINREPMLFENAPSRARRLVRDGDTIVSTVRTYLKAISPIQDPEPNLVVSTGFAVFRPRAVDPGFLSYCLRSHYFIESVVSLSVGVSYPATNASDVATIPIPIPDPQEQRAIVSYLDRGIAEIDEMSRRTELAIERLQEYRIALITSAVAGSIDIRSELA